MPSKLKLIINPIAGGGRAIKILPKIIKIFEQYNYDIVITKTTVRGDAQKSAADITDNCQILVAMGGDGTVNEVVNGILNSQRNVSLGIIPIGTANVLSKELFIRKNFQNACQTIINGNTKIVDVCKHNNRFFLLMSGVGFDAEVVRLIESFRKGNISLLTYIIPIIRTFWNYKFPKFVVEVDGKFTCPGIGFMLVSNIRRYTGPFIITNMAKIDDGKLDVFIFKCSGRLKLLKYALGALFRMVHLFNDIKYLQGRNVSVRSVDGSNIPYQVDGDSGGFLPQDFTVIPKAISIIVPKRYHQE